MVRFVSEDIIDDIQARSDIVETISRYIPLKRAGANFKALCPFHSEKTPSFTVSPAKQIYHCFGCGAGGNVFTFIRDYEKVGFIEAVKIAADRAGIVIPDAQPQKYARQSKDLWKVNEFACRFFSRCFYSSAAGKKAYDYLAGRGIRDDIIKKFRLGYAPSGGEFIKEAEKNGFSRETLLKAGLIVKSRSGYNNMFGGRLIFPLFNITGKPAGFSGRVLDNSLPKYINTQETPIFYKGGTLYGLCFTKQEIAKSGTVVICEGYFDFLRAYQEGLRTIAAVQGTAFTNRHIHLLRRYAPLIIVSFDGDAAGDKAFLNKLQMFLEEDMYVKAVILPQGADPDSFIREKGIDAYRRLIAEAQDILDIKLKRLCSEYGTDTTGGKLKIISGLMPDIANISNEIYKREFIKRVSKAVSVPEDSLQIELEKVKKGKNRRGKQDKASAGAEQIFLKQGKYSAEKFLLNALFTYNRLPDNVLDGFDVGKVRDSEYKTLLELMLRLKKDGRWRGPVSMIQHLKDKRLLEIVSQLSVSEVSGGIDKMRIIRDCIYKIEKEYREERVRVLISRMQEAEKNKQDVSSFIYEINSLSRR